MKNLCRVFAIFALVFLGASTWAQNQHYVPMQILFPTVQNATYFQQYPPINQYNYTNNSTNLGWQNPALYGPGVASSATGLAWNRTTPDGDFIMGQIGHLDHLLFNQTYFKARRWWGNREKIIEYPKDSPNFNRHETISAIRAYNRFYDGLNSEVRILEGGVGKRYVKIQIRSSWGKGFKYAVQIFGR